MIYPGPKTKPFAFIHIAKSGGSSITKTLADYIGEPREKYRDGNTKFIRASAIPFYLDEPDNYFKFTVIRNPFSRVVSFYHYKQQIRHPPHNLSLDITFEDWIEKYKGYREIPHIHTSLCMGKSGKPVVSYWLDFIGRLETINNDWITICNKLKINPSDCPLIHDKKSEHKPYQEYYNDKTRKIIQDYFTTDLKLFHYSFEGLAATEFV